MYSGTTFRTKSGRMMGVHQRIDRVARRHYKHHGPAAVEFPDAKSILHFEGKNGPDGIKRKSPAKDEPWHYIDPNDPTDNRLPDMISNHIHNLTNALIDKNPERAAFEAAWLAHAITDGLTPAHHYPLEKKLMELRGGQSIETRITTKEKLVMHGDTKRAILKNNWEYWGLKGVMTTHLGFELGVASTITGKRLEKGRPTGNDVVRLQQDGFDAMFKESLHKIADMKMYEEFSQSGWTRRLARETNDVLMPQIIKTVCLAWLEAAFKAEEALGEKS